MAVRSGPIGRFVVGAACGLIVGFSVGPVLGAAAGWLAGWGTGALAAVIYVLAVVWRMDAEQTRTHAQREDPGRRFTGLIAVIGSVASLAAVAAVLFQASDVGIPGEFVLAGIAVGSVVASWALIQVDYMLRVARVYYTEPVGGISFNQDEPPMYTDFVYLAVGLAMTYQVADTNLQTNELRKIVIGQTMLAYLFGAVILATAINLVAGLQ